MKNQEMSLKTKQTIAGALKKCMLKKPLSKISVSELSAMCGINRNTFYYHFTDIYDLLKWMLEQEAIEVVRKTDLLVNTEEAIRFVVDYVNENKHIINCAYDSMGHEEMKRFLYTDFINIMRSTIDNGEEELKLSVPIEFKDFIAEFYTEALTGMLISWVKNRQEKDQEELIQNLLLVFKTSIPQLLKIKSETESIRRPSFA